MKIFILWWLLLLSQPLSVFAQTFISGHVVFTDGKPADGFVMVCDLKQETITAFIQIDGEGHYDLGFTTKADSVCLKVTGMTIETQIKTIVNRSQQIDFCVVEKKQELKSVLVKVDKVQQHGDTINYNVASYTGQDDRVIGDVLKNMPGIDVEESGAIKYNGKSISKFYIEDMDLLQGRYGIAVHNINANDVTSVQILENHQPIKALQNKGLDNGVAINLKLKDTSKNNFKFSAVLGVGGQNNDHHIGQNPLWISELTDMYFGEHQQNISLYKGNNTGTDVTNELTEHYSGINNISLYPLNPISVVLPLDANLPQNRTSINRSNIVTANHLKQIQKDSEINLNVGYSNDQISRQGTTISNWYLGDKERLSVHENLKSVSVENKLNLQTRYCKNSENVFLTNVLNVYANWMTDEVQTDMVTSFQNCASSEKLYDEAVRQFFKHPQIKIDNTLNYIRNVGRHTIDLHLSAGYSERRNSLHIDIDQTDMVNDERYVQEMTSRHSAANAYSKYTLRLKDFYYTCGATAYADLLGFRSHLDFCPFPDVVTESDTRNDFWYNTYGLDIDQCFSYRSRYKELSFGCPFRLLGQQVNNRAVSDHVSYAKILFSPFLLLRHSLQFWNYECIASYNKNIGNVNDSYTGYLMNNYRVFQRNYADYLYEAERMEVSGTIKFRNPLHVTFLDMEAHYGHGWSNQMNNIDYQGATTLITTTHHATSTNNYSVGVRFDKGFDLLQSKLSLFANYSYDDGERMANSQFYNYQHKMTGLGMGGTMTFFSRLNLVLSSGCNWSVSLTDANEASQGTVCTSTQRIKTNFYATQRLVISLIVEDNYNNHSILDRHAWFADVAAVLKMKKLECDIQLNNLFNQREYAQVYYSGMDIYSTTCRLRPLNGLVSFRFNLN